MRAASRRTTRRIAEGAARAASRSPHSDETTPYGTTSGGFPIREVLDMRDGPVRSARSRHRPTSSEPPARRGHDWWMSSDVRTSADTLAQAVMRHAQAVGDASPEARQQAGRALVQALEDYGVAVVNSGNELPVEFEDFDAWLGEEDGIEHPEPEPDLRQRIAFFTRTDLAVSDPDRLRAAAAGRGQFQRDHPKCGRRHRDGSSRKVVRRSVGDGARNHGWSGW